jgi:tetratricopeptide (TPR) repeat protein
MFSRREFTKAEHYYLQALQINPFSYRALLGRAAIAQKKADLVEAEQIYRKILAIYPGQAYANYMFSQAAHRRGAFLTALVYARQAAVANKRNKEYQRWHEYIKTSFANRLTLSGD